MVKWGSVFRRNLLPAARTHPSICPLSPNTLVGLVHWLAAQEIRIWSASLTNPVYSKHHCFMKWHMPLINKTKQSNLFWSNSKFTQNSYKNNYKKYKVPFSDSPIYICHIYFSISFSLTCSLSLPLCVSLQ